jgi:hypothetical protein
MLAYVVDDPPENGNVLKLAKTTYVMMVVSITGGAT